MGSRHRCLLAFNGWIVIVLFACFLSSSANFCEEENALPYQINISADGELQLSCIKLKCAFGVQGEDGVSSGSTNNITASERDDTKQATSNNGTICRSEPWSSSCAADGQGWFGGSASLPAAKKCCHNDKIKAYKQHSQRLLHHGDNFLGGAVIENNRQVAFDFISDARKLKDGQSRSKYLVVMSRMVCLPEPSHPTNEVESGLEEKLVEEVKKLNKDGAANAKAHGVGTEGDEYVEESDPNCGTDCASKKKQLGKSEASKLQPPPIGNNGSTSAPNDDDYVSDTPESRHEEEDPSLFQDQATDGNCFTSPSGHRCCSRQIETLLQELPNAINHQLDENTNTSDVQRMMLNFLKGETDERDRFKLFCGNFEHIISKSDFAARSHILGANSEALGCKMQIRIGGNRYRRQADGSDPFVFTVLTYAVARDRSAETYEIVFRNAPEPLPEQPIQQFVPQPLIPFPAGLPAPLPFAPQVAPAIAPQVAPAIAPQVAPAVAPQVAPAVAPQVANVFVQPVVQAAPAVGLGGGGGGGRGAGGSGGGGCFSGDTVVKTEKGIKRMDELVIGDIVLSADRQTPAFSSITTFLHRVPDRKMTFYKIDTASGDSTMSIKLTGNHFIYATDCINSIPRRIYASEVELGHCLLVLDEERALFIPTPVVNVSKIWQTGIYSPLTSTGTIVVNNLLASCHSSATGFHDLHQTFLYWLETVNSWISRAAMFLNVKLFDEDVFELSKGVEFVLSVFEMILPSLSAYS